MATPKKANPKNGGGPKFKFVITPEVLDEIRRLAGNEMTQQDMCAYFGICEDTWYDRKKQHPEMAEAIRIGKVKTKDMVVDKLLVECKSGNMQAIKFYLATRHKWLESAPPEKDQEPQDLRLGTNDPVEAAQVYQSIMMGE